MAKIPIKFNRVAAAFDEAAKWHRPCDSSSGSEYWPESGADLSDLVNSFIEKGDHGMDHNFKIDIDEVDINEDIGNESCDANWVSDNDEDDTQRKEMLQSLLLECTSSSKKKSTRQKIWNEIDVALKLFGGFNGNVNDVSRSSFKRSLMAHLRDKGFDAGLCKSRWEKTGRFPAGTYEYIDVNVGKSRYIVEVFMAGEFEIARPTSRYTSLVEMIPSILIIKNTQVLKQITRLMSNAMRESLKQANMLVAPWRRNGYLQAKYFSPYKRTTNRDSSLKNVVERDEEVLAKKRSSIGFEADQFPRVSYYCRDVDFGNKVHGIRVGLLASVLQGK
ncbi:uncharacterized protein LOC110687101 [Chenopodium quinoa]|uniref:uncharacterized protein LOC110687101 n=1 Tax=Chenopodium quinoa TaxID=63459 RepID=UPI000B793E73|nr:uncharacterized protein LOC110687101 [Chenopodium quinoa]